MQAAEDDGKDSEAEALRKGYHTAEPHVLQYAHAQFTASHQGEGQGWQLASKRGRHTQLPNKAAAHGRKLGGHAGNSTRVPAQGKQNGR